MKLIDANVVIYSLGKPHHYRDASIAVMERTSTGAIEANIDVEGMQEVVHYFHKRGVITQTIGIWDDMMQSFPDPLPVDGSTITIARALLAEYPFLQSRDAFHSAVVFQRNLEGIISADRTFDRVAGLRRFDPVDLAE